MLRFSSSFIALLSLVLLHAAILAVAQSPNSTTILETRQVAKPDLRSIFRPGSKRMLAWGYDDRKAPSIGNGPKISSYHHWQSNVVSPMPSKNTFIPTFWGPSKWNDWNAVKATMGSKIPPVVMSFNEPDISSQANMDPKWAAQVFYDEITVKFGNKGSNVVAPAIVWNVDGWLAPFMSRCNQLGCRIDAMGQHVYVGINNNVPAAVASVKNQITNVYRKFGKPIVLSELGLTQAGGGSDAQIVDFVKQIGSWLDSQDYVLAWALSAVFSKGQGWDGYLNSNMAFFNSDGSLRDLAYKYMYDSF